MARCISLFQYFLLSCIILFQSLFLPTALAKANSENHTSRNTVILLTSLANAGRAEAQYSLAKLYLTGNGVEQDYSKAVQWLKLAAQQDHAAAQNHLGLMYFNGTGVIKNCETAISWFKTIKTEGYIRTHALSNLAWALSTCPDANHRNGEEAVKIVQDLLKNQQASANLLDTMAAAYAEAGQFEQASQTQQQAIKLLTSDKKSSETQMARFKARLQHYQQKKPWRIAETNL